MQMQMLSQLSALSCMCYRGDKPCDTFSNKWERAEGEERIKQGKNRWEALQVRLRDACMDGWSYETSAILLGL